MLEDALKIGFTRNRHLIQAWLTRIEDYLCPLDYGVWQAVEGGFRIKLKPAGHILGSAYAEIDAEGKRVVLLRRPGGYSCFVSGRKNASSPRSP